MTWLNRILITLASVAALLMVPVVALVIYDIYERTQVARFYEAHPMLRAMNELPDQPYAERQLRMADILLKRLPLGSTLSQALDVFATEGMKCERPARPLSRPMLICSVTAPRMRWHIEVQLDGNDKVSGGRVLTLKA